MTQKTSQFWVFFDAAPIAQYCGDVHNVIALPQGSIMHYDYRNPYLSSDALQVCNEDDAPPEQVLVVYCQSVDFVRGQELPTEAIPRGNALVLATRLGRLVMPPRREGDNNHFYFALKGYPTQDDGALDEILSPLFAHQTVPYQKYVCLSDATDAIGTLASEGTDADNWHEIAELLSTFPSQFLGDQFWRIDGPFLGRGRIRPEHLKGFEGRTLKSVATSWRVPERRTVTVGFTAYSPPSAEVLNVGDLGRSNFVSIAVPEDGLVQLETNQPIDLRQRAAETLRFRSKRAGLFDTAKCTITLTPQTDDSEPEGVPIGPTVDLPMTVYKPGWLTLFCVILMFAGAVMVTAGLAFKNTLASQWLLAVLAMGAGFLLVGSLLLFGIPRFRP